MSTTLCPHCGQTAQGSTLRIARHDDGDGQTCIGTGWTDEGRRALAREQLLAELDAEVRAELDGADVEIEGPSERGWRISRGDQVVSLAVVPGSSPDTWEAVDRTGQHLGWGSLLDITQVTVDRLAQQGDLST